VPVQWGRKGSSAKGSGASNTSKKTPTLHNLLFVVKVSINNFSYYASCAMSNVSLQQGTPFSEINPPHNHPIIVVMKDIDDSSLDCFYIMVENVTMNDATGFTQALFAVYSTFNKNS